MAVYVSVDCGVRNLAYCVYDTHTQTLLQWAVVSLASTRANIATIVESACRFVHTLVRQYGTDAPLHTVYIEQQPVANVKMKCLSHALQAAFCSAKVRVEFASARNTHRKLGLLKAAPKKRSYSTRKRQSVQRTEEELSRLSPGGSGWETWHSMYRGHTKQDDLADCFLQLLAWVPQPPQPPTIPDSQSTSVVSSPSSPLAPSSPPISISAIASSTPAAIAPLTSSTDGAAGTERSSVRF